MKTARRHSTGFTLLELLVSIAIFLVVASVALSLVAKSLPLYNRQQGMTALNIGLRSAVTQIEQDVVNAGTGYYVGINFPDWPVGVTILQPPAGTCYDSTTHVYSASCFDTLNVITTDPNTPPANLNAPTVASVNGTLDLNVPTSINPATGLAWTVGDYADEFHDGDQILLLNTGGSQLTTFKLTDDGAVNGAVVQLTHSGANLTNANGTNGTNAGDVSTATACSQTSPPDNDYLAITMCSNDKLGASFIAGDWVLKLASVTYWVDATDTTNPKLVRRVGPPIAGSDVVAEQVIGFKVGAAVWNNGNGTGSYTFDPALYPNMSSNPWDGGFDPYNYTRVRSVRVSVIGRTTPSTDPTYSFRNTFDVGAYQIQAASVVVNPRNLSMRDN